MIIKIETVEERELRKQNLINRILEKTNGLTVLKESGYIGMLAILMKYGKLCNVQAPKEVDRTWFKYQQCYYNSWCNTPLMDYIEGEARSYEVNVQHHAWNRDKEGNYFDYTYDNPEENEYFGVVIPARTLKKYKKHKGQMLLYIKSFDEIADVNTPNENYDLPFFQ